MTSQLVHHIRQALADSANPDKAEGMRAYMKSEMPFRGVQKPARRKLVNAFLRTDPLAEKPVWEDFILQLWRNAEYIARSATSHSISPERRSTSPTARRTSCPCSKSSS